MKKRILIQGFPGCFHEEAALHYYGEAVEGIPCASFEEMAKRLEADDESLAIMAIENSIAGSILQNYRLLREKNFWISGEIYLRIKHNLMTLKGISLSDIRVIRSHPMAINQCLPYISTLSGVRVEETEDTALVASKIQQHQWNDVAAIASETAADMYDLDIQARGIESSKINFTRFFIISRDRKEVAEVDKASIYIRVSEKVGSLLKVLRLFSDHHINITNLQSYPVLGKWKEYYFHIDLEFEKFEDYVAMKNQIEAVTHEFRELGLYKGGSIERTTQNTQDD